MLVEKIVADIDPNNSILGECKFEVNDKKYRISIGQCLYKDCHWIDVEDILPDGSFGGVTGSWDNTIYKEEVGKCVPKEIAIMMLNVIDGFASMQQLSEMLYKMLPSWFESKCI